MNVSKAQTLNVSSPVMGWNSWNTFGTNINEKLIKNEIDSIVSKGLKNDGYRTIVLDGGWQATKLDKNGKLVYDQQKFLHGIKFLADYAHNNGLKLGLHLIAGTASCSGKKQGSYGNEAIQVQQLRNWNIDFVKVDLCRNKYGWTPERIQQTFTLWGQLLRSVGITYSASAYQFYPWLMPFASMARTTEDIAAPAGGLSGLKATFQGPVTKTRKDGWDSSLSVMQIALINNLSAKYAGNGYWNDPDMLVTGSLGLTIAEQQTHFALWCIMTAPLFLGDDPAQITPYEAQIISNKTAIAIDQDTTEQGHLVKANGHTQIWLKHLNHAKRGILLINLDKSRPHIIDYKQYIPLPFEDQKAVFSNLKLEKGVHQLLVKPDSSVFLLVSPSKS